MRIVPCVNLERVRAELKAAREGIGLRQGPKIGRPALSRMTQAGFDKPVNSQTIKNIEDGRIADPGIVTIARIVEALGLTLATFFARVEGTDLSRHSTDQESELPGGSDVPASAERDRISRLESELSTLKAQFGVLQNATSQILDRAFPRGKSRAAASGKTGGRRVPRTTS
jgi:hypothetical protein